MATRETLEARAAQCKGAADLYALAREALDAPADIAYAGELLTRPEFGADPQARKLLDDTAAGAMFTADFVALALGYKALGDAAQAADMLKQGQDFAMSGEEKVLAGLGTFMVSGDATAAVKALSAALKEISATEELYNLARVVTTELKEAGAELAGQIFDKIKTKAGRAADFARLAKAVLAGLGDRAKAAALITEGAQKYSSPADLITLSAAMGEIDPAAAGDLYAKALESAKDFTALMQVLESAKGNAEFTRQVLAKGAEIAASTGEFLQLAEVYVASGDAAGVADMLGRAEAAVNNLDDLRKVVAAVEKHAPADAERLARLKDKLAKREANQAKYVEIQNAEAKATTVKQFIQLADRVLAELEDTAYAGKLLAAAESMLRADGFHFSRFKPLVLAVDRLGDKDWLARLLEESVAAAGDFVWFREVVLTAARELKDTAFGRERARAYLQARAAQAGDNPYDWTKLAELVLTALGERDWAAQLLDEAARRARDHFALAHVGKLYRQMGEEAKARELFTRAVQACTSADQCVQLARRMKSYELPASEIEPFMDDCAAVLKTPADKLAWAEGVADLLLDADWARRAYARIEADFSQPAERKRYEQSRNLRLGYRFFGPGVQAH
ncbi:MAG: hypothetical protein NZ524_11160 [Thiobacillaceae bacterium]|nr:hypothetical protein [Thiobacillaceae bacterium]MDW8323600.1 hypothetical protein [Burkholderiales bacterium]